MFVDDAVLVLTAAFLLDAVLGDPVYRWHPVRLIGQLAASVERGCFAVGLSGCVGGAVFFTATVGGAIAAYWGGHLLLSRLHPLAALPFDTFVFYSTFALTDLRRHTRPIRRALDGNDLNAARDAVQWIVGRDVQNLDETGVARAAVESVAENFVDSLLSPIFWYALTAGATILAGAPARAAGVTAALVYRTANTLDAMVGYKNERYATFGFTAAKVDDFLNYIPARLAILPLFLTALIGAHSPAGGLRAWRRDRHKSPSPNAGHTESFVAGALGIRLGGPTIYRHGTVEKPWLGSGTRRVTAHHIRLSARLITIAGWLSAGGALILLVSLPHMRL